MMYFWGMSLKHSNWKDLYSISVFKKHKFRRKHFEDKHCSHLSRFIRGLCNLSLT